MSRVITFSRVFPSYHPRKGDPTYFVEQIWNGFRDEGFELSEEYYSFVREYQKIKRVGEHLHFGGVKHHTIRAGHRWKVGDYFSPRVWSGEPYNSKQIQFAPDIQVMKVWDFDAEGTDFFLSGKHEITHPEGFDFSELEKNDGLSNGALIDWICLSPDFKKKGNKFSGQVICWNDSLTY